GFRDSEPDREQSNEPHRGDARETGAGTGDQRAGFFPGRMAEEEREEPPMKAAKSGVRGVFGRANPRGTQRLRGGTRGAWWAGWACGCGKLHRELLGPKALASEECERRRTRARVEDWCPTRERNQRVTVKALLGLVESDYRVNSKRSLRTMLCAQKPLLT